MENILEKINKAAIKFLQPLAPKETFKMIVEEAIKLVHANAGSIFLEEKGEIKKVYSSDPLIWQIKTRKRGYVWKAFKKRQSFVTDTIGIRKIHPEIKKLGIKSNMYIPLSYKNKSIGILVIHSNKSIFFTREELKILWLFGSLASLAIRKTQLYDETKKALESRDLFISMAAHELRTPLTTINGYIQLLSGKLPNTKNAESRWIGELAEEGVRLTNLVNDFLTVERIKTGHLQYTWKEILMPEIINKAITNFRFIHPHHKIVFTDNSRNSKNVIIGDFDKLLLAIINLLDNAAKFSSFGSLISIEIVDKLSGVNLIIKDTGQGILSKDLSRVFERFYQSADNTREGMGLGLFLVKTIINDHNGRIKIKSKVNKGTSVEVHLPKIYHD